MVRLVLLTNRLQCDVYSNHQLRVLGNPDDGRGGAERQNSDSQVREKKLKGWTEAGHFTAHTSHNRNQELSGGRGEIRERQRERASPRKPRKQNL